MIPRAITFDFWNTLYTDGGSPIDAIVGHRLQILRRALEACGGTADDGQLDAAYRSGFNAYLGAWERGQHFGAREQVTHVFEQLGAVCRGSACDTAALEIEETGRQAELRVLPGVLQAIPHLAQSGVRLGLISDTGLTPGRILREVLEKDGLLRYFSALTFSDETGFPKPDERMFLGTLAQLGAEPADAAHIGDTARTDIAGAKRLGIVAVRFAAVRDDAGPPEADAVISDHRDLLDTLAQLRPRDDGPGATHGGSG
jgi:putative hydrolase of the HAD superfamily